MEFDQVPAIDHLNRLVERFDQCPRKFVRRFSFLELWALYRAWALSGLIKPPHLWTRRQLDNALIGKVPR